MLNDLALTIHTMVEKVQPLPNEQTMLELHPLLDLPGEDLVKRMELLGPLNWFAVPANPIPNL